MTYRDRPIGEFLDTIASERVTPAGGTALAVAGAMSAALIEMACIHSPSSDDDGSASPNLSEAQATLASRREQLLELGEQDAAVVDVLFGGGRSDPPRDAFKRAIGVPLAIAEACLQVLEIGQVVCETVTSNVVADAQAGVYLAHAVLQGGIYIVRTNLAVETDRAFVDRMIHRVEELERAANQIISD